MGYSGEDKAGRKGIGTVCRVCQTNGAGPCGEEIIMGSVSVKHVNTIQKRGKGRWEVGRWWWWGGPRRCWAHEDPGSPQQHWPCQRMSVIRRGDPVALPGNAAGFPFVSREEEERGEGRGGRRGGTVSLFQPRPYESSPTIVRKLQLHFSDLLCTPVDSGY